MNKKKSNIVENINESNDEISEKYFVIYQKYICIGIICFISLSLFLFGITMGYKAEENLKIIYIISNILCIFALLFVAICLPSKYKITTKKIPIKKHVEYFSGGINMYIHYIPNYGNLSLLRVNKNTDINFKKSKENFILVEEKSYINIWKSKRLNPLIQKVDVYADKIKQIPPIILERY